MSYSLNSLKGVISEAIQGSIVGVGRGIVRV